MVRKKSAIKKYSELAQELKKGILKNNYIFIGNENFLKDHYRNLIKKTLHINTNQLSETIFYPDSTDLKNIFYEIETSSFFFSSKLIIIKYADKLSTSFLNNLKKYFLNEIKGNYLILDCLNFPWSTNSKDSIKLLEYSYDFSITKTEYSHYLDYFLKQNKKRATDSAKRIILNMYSNLYDMKNNIEKLSLYTDKRNLIDVEDLNILTTASQSISSFYFLDSLFEKNTSKALHTLKMLYRQGESIYSLVGLIRMQIIKFIKIKYALIKKKDINSLLTSINIPAYKKNDIIRQAKNFSIQELIKNLQMLSNFDYKVKTSALTPEHSMEMLVIEFCKTAK